MTGNVKKSPDVEESSFLSHGEPFFGGENCETFTNLEKKSYRDGSKLYIMHVYPKTRLMYGLIRFLSDSGFHRVPDHPPTHKGL